jgi:hypothetical protein
VFANPLAVIVTANNSIEPVVGGAVIFSAPVDGASATLNPTGPATIASNGQASVTATANGTAGSYTVTASASGVATPADFSLTNVAGAFNITGQVYNDLDGNSLKGRGEPGLAGWTLDLLNSSGAVIGTTITDNNGNYSFNGVAPGTLSVAEVAQPDWVQTEPLFPTVYAITGKSGVNLSALNFGDHSAASLSPATVIDNGQGGYGETGSWSTVVGGFNGTNRVARTVRGSKPTATASWTFNSLTVGSYNVWITFSGKSMFSTAAPFTVYDGANNLGSTSINESILVTQAHAGMSQGSYGGVGWLELGTYSIGSGTLAVLLSNATSGSFVDADGVLIVPTEAPAVIASPGKGPATNLAIGIASPLTDVSSTGSKPRSSTSSVVSPTIRVEGVSQPGALHVVYNQGTPSTGGQLSTSSIDSLFRQPAGRLLTTRTLDRPTGSSARRL